MSKKRTIKGQKPSTKPDPVLKEVPDILSETEDGPEAGPGPEKTKKTVSEPANELKNETRPIKPEEKEEKKPDPKAIEAMEQNRKNREEAEKTVFDQVAIDKAEADAYIEQAGRQIEKENENPKPDPVRPQYAFPRDPACPKCGLHETSQTTTQGKIQYRKCMRSIPVCGHTFKVIGREVVFTDNKPGS